MSHSVVRPLLAAFLLSSGFAMASEADVKANMERFLGAPAVESVTQTRYGALYEVVLKTGELIYTDKDVNFIIDGSIIDAKTRSNVTQQRLLALSAVDFDSLPFKDAIKQVKGDGSRVLASFEDPNCGYCKKLGQELEKVDNLTLYTFLMPILSADSREKSKNIWCASNPGQTWNDWILNGKAPGKADCDISAIDRNNALGRTLRINGTPTLFLKDGTRIGGFVPATELEKALTQAATPAEKGAEPAR
jgi:thiol:disulfide interchange protein DsbC